MNADATGERKKRPGKAPRRPEGRTTAPPPEGFEKRAAVMILSGEMPPEAWWPHIRRLDVSAPEHKRNDFADLAPLRVFSGLRELNCAWTRVIDLAPLRALTSLQTLDCSYTQVSDLAPLRPLTNLQMLHCYTTQVSDLAPLRALTNLQTLHCGGTQVSDLAPLRALTNLQTLHCSGTQVSDLAPLRALINLQTLNCYNTKVSDLASLCALTNLQTLHCYLTQVSDLAPLRALTNLQTLNCDGTQVSDLAPLRALANLQTLRCGGTQVSDLAPLRGLNNLQTLGCFSTIVSDLEPLGGLTKLRDLDCSYLRLTTGQETICRLPDLRRLVLHDTTIPGVPAEALSQDAFDNCLDRLRAHLDDLGDDPVLIPDVKLLVLGNGRAGKTQLVNRLRGLPFSEHWNSTHGVAIETVDLPAAGRHAEARLNVWDFGGQDIYHGTHALFARANAVFLVAWSADTNNGESYIHQDIAFRNHDLAYWIDYVRHVRGAGPVLVVQTKCDERGQGRPRAPVGDTVFPEATFRRELRFSAKTDRGRDELMLALREAIADLREAQGGQTIGPGRKRVRRRLEEMAARETDPVRTLALDEFDLMCREDGGISAPRPFLEYLHNAGVVFHRANLFGGRIVLDQKWALEAIYAVLDRGATYRRLLRQQGKFNRQDLADSIWTQKGYSVAEQRLFLSMMEQCGVCFAWRKRYGKDEDETVWIAPDTLPDRSEVRLLLDDAWGEAAADAWAEFRYDFLHHGLIRGLIAWIGTEAGMEAVYWRGGVYARETTTGGKLLIAQQMTEGDWHGVLRVETKGPRAEELCARVAAWIQRENERHHLEPRRERSSPRPPPDSREPKLDFSPARREYCVSYAWNDATHPDQEADVDRFCAEAERRGIAIVRDKTSMGLGDRISAFMRRLAAGKQVYVFLSEKYLRSDYCITELYHVWIECRANGDEFAARVRVHFLPGTDIGNPFRRGEIALYWKRRYEELRPLHQEGVLGRASTELFRVMQHFALDADDILHEIQDRLRPTSFGAFLAHAFDDAAERP